MSNETKEKTWTAPELTEFDIADRTMAGDGPDDDGQGNTPELS